MKTTYCITRYICLTAVIFLAGCATYQPLQTPSGRPEVTIHGATKKDILDTIITQMLNDGWQKRKLSEHGVVVGRPTDKWETILAYGSPSNNIPENQISFTLVDAGNNGVQVFCSGAVITNAGSGFENVAEIVGGKFYTEAQAALEKLKLKMEK